MAGSHWPLPDAEDLDVAPRLQPGMLAATL